MRFVVVLGLLLLTMPSLAQSSPTDVCPSQAIQPRPAEFSPGGIILTTFDNSAIWVYNIDGDSRYPLPDTVPCTRNCRVSPDHRWLLHMATDFSTYKMRMDGTQRTLMVGGAADVEWWDASTLLVWTPDHRAYLIAEGIPNTEDQRRYLDARGVVAVQPGGTYALTLQRQSTDTFIRVLENLEFRELVGVAGAAPVQLGTDITFYNDAAWSPDGARLAYVGQTNTDTGAISSELFGIRPEDESPTQWTQLTANYGPVRINGHSIGDLSWSPDSTRVAFWVIAGEGDGVATIHLYDVRDGTLSRYCGFTTTEHNPNPPRLVWSPGGTHIAFGGNVPNDDKGYLLLALNTNDGNFIELSNGVYPALGSADVIAWGIQ